MALITLNSEKRPSRKSRKILEREKATSLRTGVTVNGIEEEKKRRDGITLYFSNAVLNFAAVYGTVGCLCSGLEIRWNSFMLAVLLLVSACGLSLFYKKQWIRLSGYLISFTAILYCLQQYILTLRSGFAVISNAVMHKVEAELSLPMEREYEIYVKNEDLAVNVCLLLIGFVFLMLFNIIISEMKNYWIVLFFTFPFVGLPIYLNCRINMVYFAIYAGSIIAVFCLRTNGHYETPNEKVQNYTRQHFGQDDYEVYRAEGHASLAVIVGVFLVIGVALLGQRVLINRSKFMEKHTAPSALKAKSQEFAKKLALVGFWGMFSGDGSGGIMGGKLGQVGRVRPDFETDIYLTIYRSKGESNLYLRQFSGNTYTGNEWKEEEDDAIAYQPADEFMFFDYFTNARICHQYKNIVIENVGVYGHYPLIPYFNGSDAETKYVNGKISEFKHLSIDGVDNRFYCMSPGRISVPELKKRVADVLANTSEYSRIWDSFTKMEKRYRNTVYEYYLDVDAAQKERLLELCAQQGIYPGDEDAVEKIQVFLMENYLYTLMPGKTPKDKDFVDYFLFEQKKGYCVYFASAATLLYRSLGIPARYVCGYAAGATNFSEADVLETDGEGNEKIRLSLTDADAHAWVEVYVDGFGWWPVEVTMSDEAEDEEDDDAVSFFDLVTNLFRPENVAKVKDSVVFGLLYLGCLLAAFAAVYELLLLFRIRSRAKRFAGENSPKVHKEMFTYLCKLAGADGQHMPDNASLRERADVLRTSYGLDGKKLLLLVMAIEKESFGGYSLLGEESEEFAKTEAILESQIKERMSGGHRFAARWVRGL